MKNKYFEIIKSTPSYRNAVIVFLITILFTTICEVQVLMERRKPPIEYINRGKEGNLIVNEKLTLSVDGIEKNISLEVNPKEYEYEELEIMWEELAALMPSIMNQKEEDSEIVDCDLNFPLEVKGYPFVLTYSTSNEDYMDKQGKLGNGMEEGGSNVIITVTAKNNSPVFKGEKEYSFNVFPRDSYDSFAFRLKQKLIEEEQLGRNKEDIRLPTSFEGKNVSWKKSSSNKSFYILLIGSVASLALIIGKKEEDTKAEKKLQEAMELAYPEMVTRLAMYMGAGMTITAAFNRMASLYENESRQNRNPLQEQIILTKREMEAGISEMEAMKNLAIRCKISQISRLAALIVQGSRRGSMGIKVALKEETKQALSERKSKALILGEQAGTKLLVPMMMMLIMVMGIIMVPAFTSFAL